MNQFLSSLGDQVEDAEEESFLLFTRDIPSGNLGFLDSRAPSVEITIHEADYTVHQSPTVLSSSRAGGTTGAVLWKITPRLAEWISSPSNPLWTQLTPSTSTVVELGCGISGLLALSLGPGVGHYIATDQEYVYRLLRENLEANRDLAYNNNNNSKNASGRNNKRGKKDGGGGGRAGQKKRDKSTSPSSGLNNTNISFAALDWELDDPGLLKESVGITTSSTLDNDQDDANKDEEEGGEEEDKGFDLLLSCDCVYNDALVAPFVRTCADICRLRPAYRHHHDHHNHPDESNGRTNSKLPTICIVAQQQRVPDVFEAWLKETLKVFWVWRLRDEVLGDGLKDGTGYVVHLLLLRENSSV